MSRRLHTGFFEDERDLLEAVSDCRSRGIPIVDVVSPFPVHGLDEALGLRRSRLPYVTLAGGAVGLAIGLWLQYWTSAVDWPLNIGGKPFDSLPAFVPVAFELTILFAGLGTAALLLLRSGLWPGRRLSGEHADGAGTESSDGLERTTDDRHALILAQEDAAFRERDLLDLLTSHGAVDLDTSQEVQP